MERRLTRAVVMLAALTTSPAVAQMVVQLPTYYCFAVNTSVSVPDRGGAFLGGFGGSQSAAARFGQPLLPRSAGAAGRGGSSAGAAATATVHDFDAMDQALLGDSRPAALSSAESAQAAARRLAVDAALPSVAALRAQRERDRMTRQAEAQSLLALGRGAEEAGNTAAARVYYHMAARRADGPLKQEAAQRLAALAQSRR